MNRCQNCEWEGTDDELGCRFEDIPDLSLRIAPGEIVPSGECPKCGCLCSVIDQAARIRHVAPELLAVCKQLVWSIESPDALNEAVIADAKKIIARAEGA